jgi:hypothetical protein
LMRKASSSTRPVSRPEKTILHLAHLAHLSHLFA